MPVSEKKDFLSTYTDSGLDSIIPKLKVDYILIEKEKDPENGMFLTTLNLLAGIETHIAPQLTKINDRNLS